MRLALFYEFSNAGSKFISDLGEIEDLIGPSRENLQEIVPELPSDQAFPTFFDSGPKTLKMIEAILDRCQPAKIVETGVANGASTRIFLAKLSKEGAGRLISFDIEEIAQNSIAEPEMLKFWEFRLIKKRFFFKMIRQFKMLTADLNSVDIWYHDSDHSYLWQKMEYQLAYEKLRPGGFLISDDIDWSFAWQEFLTAHPEISFKVVLVDGNKVSGAIQKPWR